MASRQRQAPAHRPTTPTSRRPRRRTEPSIRDFAKGRPSGRPFHFRGLPALGPAGRGTAAIWPCRGIFAGGDSGRFMAEAADDLSTPLGQETVARRTRRFRLPFTPMQALAVLLGLFLVGFAGFALFNDDPMGGEPRAKIVLRQPAAEADKAAAAAHSSAETKATPRQPAAGPSAGQQTVTIIDGSSGKRQEFVIGGDTAAKDGNEQAPVPMAGIDQRLLEKSRYGMIPVMADGLKPFTVYAAEADRARAARMPVVAVVVGGLGV